MADDPTLPSEVEQTIEETTGGEIEAPRPANRKQAPSYKVVGDSKIPVSDKQGSVWKSRKEIAIKSLGDLPEAWEEAIRYFENDQTGHRQITSRHGVGNNVGNQRINENVTETENVIFANVTTMVPTLYARNPSIEITTDSEQFQRAATQVERLVNAIIAKRSHPGISLKSKAKRAVVTSLLTNRSWINIGWTFKDDSSDKAFDDLQRISEGYLKADTTKEIEELEGQLETLEKNIAILTPAGPWAKFKGPHQVLVDPASEEMDASDAKWIMVSDFMPTQSLLARYATKDRDSKQWKSIFAPTHIMRMSSDGEDSHEDIDAFSLFQSGKSAKDHGFEDEESFEAAQLTLVWFVWDKVTRRLLLFSDKDWAWPLWVWDDPYQLENFYPIYPLTFHLGPAGPMTKGEVSYYLDQQDAINEMNDEEKRARRWARKNIFFNKNLTNRDDVEAVLNGPDGTARGLDLPEGFRLQDVIGSVIPPGINIRELYDKELKYRAIDRISSVSETLRGAQFKTNTTNDAVQANVSASNMRVDEKSDAIEDWLGAIGWGLAQMCLINMDQEMVASFIGREQAEGWVNYSPEEIRANFSMRVVGGSSKKPTSQAKKSEALEMGQVLGQFVNAAPGPVLTIMLQVMEQAFDEIVMKQEDWTSLKEAIAQQAQQGPGGGGGEADPKEAIKQLLSQLPPQLQQQVVAALQQGGAAGQTMQ